MGIDISQIINSSLRKLAEDIDSQGNKNRILDGAEISIFETECNKEIAAGRTTVEEVNEILGLEISEEAQAAVTNPIKTPELSKKDKKKYQNQIKQSVENYVKAGVKPENLIAKLQAEYDARRNPVINEVQYVLNLVNKTNYNSKDDVEKIYDTVEKQLKDVNKDDGFHKGILKSLVKQAKEIQIAREAEMLTREYKEIKATMANTDIVKEKGDNFKAYVEIVKDMLQTKDANGKKAWDSSYIQEAFEQLENYAKEDAKALVGSQINDTKKESDTRRKVGKEVKAQNKGGDAYQDEARHEMVGRLISRKKNVEGKIAARRNKVELKKVDLKAIKAEDLEDELGKSFFQKFNFFRKDKAFDKLDKNYLSSVQNADGTYNLEPLVDKIITRVGKDYLINRSKEKEMAEMTNIKRHLLTITGQEFTDFETKKILALCDIQIEKKDRSFKTIANKALFGLPGLITAAIVPLRINRSAYQKQMVQLKCYNKAQLNDFMTQFRKQGFEPDVTALTNGEFAIKIEQEQLFDDKFTEILISLGTAVLSLLTDALVAWVLGEEKDEKSCMSVSDYSTKESTYTNADEYKEYIGKIYKNPAKVEAIQGLVNAYVEAYGDDWHMHYQQALREAAGIGSKLNPEECGALKYLLPPTKPSEEVKNNNKNENKEVVNNDKIRNNENVNENVNENKNKDENENDNDNCGSTPCSATIDPRTNSLTYTRQGGDYWEGMVNAFYPCLTENGTPMYDQYKKLPNGKKVLVKEGAITKLKRALSYDENGNFNTETFKALREGGDLPKIMILPDKIENCERVNASSGFKTNVHGAGKAKIQKVGFASKDFVATDDCDQNLKATGKTKGEALANLKAKTRKTYTNEAELLK